MTRTEFTFRTSRYLVLALTLAHLGGLAIWIMCPMLLGVKVIGAVILALSFYQLFGTYFRPIIAFGTSRLIQSTDGSWRLQQDEQQIAKSLSLIGWIAHRWLVIARFVDNSKNKVNIILLPDSTDRETMRRLRVSLRNNRPVT